MNVPIDRRRFVSAAAALACGACGGGLTSCTSTVAPRVVSGPIALGRTPGEFAQGIDGSWLRSGGFVVVRHGARVYAVSATCTHRECDLEVEGGASLTCPCHGSHFDGEGHVLNGPAKRSLVRFAISQDAEGRVVVDPERTFAEPQWSDPGASVGL